MSSRPFLYSAAGFAIVSVLSVAALSSGFLAAQATGSAPSPLRGKDGPYCSFIRRFRTASSNPVWNNGTL